jgi:uncharacterized Zn-finger protein
MTTVPSPQPDHVSAVFAASGTVAAAFVVAVVGTIGAALIAARLQRKRNEQDRESQWRSHAIELTKLDAERLMRRAAPEQVMRPFILTFLAIYRDLQELGTRTPAELYKKIIEDRVNPPTGNRVNVLSETAPSVIACAGTREGGGHPRVYLTVGSDEEVVCPYCSRRYILASVARRGP